MTQMVFGTVCNVVSASCDDAWHVQMPSHIDMNIHVHRHIVQQTVNYLYISIYMQVGQG